MNGPDRGAWRLIAARDFWVRLRERSFLISTLLNVGVISVLVLARAGGGLGGAPSFDLGTVGGSDVVDVANAAATLGYPDITVRVHPYPDPASADAALRDGSIDAVVTETQLYGLESVDQRLEALVQTSAHQIAVEAVFAEHHVPQAQREAASRTSPLALGALQPAPPDRQNNAGVAFIGVLLLYGQLFGYGMWVATGVIEEKASRIVEMLLSAIRPRQLLAGKIIGIGVLGLAQLITIAAFAIGLALATGAGVVPATAIWAALLVIGWFILGYGFYASLFAAAGSLVSRMEELQNVIVPINLTILVSFIISIGSLQDPNSTLAVVASILPVSAALAMPVRIVLGVASGWQIALSLALLIGSAVALVPVGARLYAGAVLRTGSRVRLRDAWRAA
ncbi:MAG TPA: ABC transporter permease [Actinomycetota bacterium]|nr:ABC transporter permease [Actinomycetota bacterium]